MIDIPPYFVAISAFITALILFVWGKKYKILSLSLFMQFVVYVLFTILELPQETRQYIARLNAIVTNVILALIIFVNRNRYGIQ